MLTLLRHRRKSFRAAAPPTGITLEDSAVTTAQDYTAPTDIDVNIPAVSANDILLMLCTTNDYSEPTASPPAGWTKIVEQDATSQYTSTVAAYWKRASSSASATTESWSPFFPAAEVYYIWVGAYSGCVTSGSPVDAYGQANLGYGTPFSVPITTTTVNTMVVTIIGDTRNDQAYAWADGTELIDTIYGNNNASVSINEKLEAISGSKTRTATPSVTSGFAGVAVALMSADFPAGDAIILNGYSRDNTGGVESDVDIDGSSTIYGGYATGRMLFRDATKDGTWADDGLGLLWDHSTDATNWVALIGTTGGTFNVYEQGTTTLIFSLAWTGTGSWSGNTDRYGSTSVDYTGTVPSFGTRVDVYHIKS